MIPYYDKLPDNTLDMNIKEAGENGLAILKSTPEKYAKYILYIGDWDYKNDDYALADIGNFNYGAFGVAEDFSCKQYLKRSFKYTNKVSE